MIASSALVLENNPPAQYYAFTSVWAFNRFDDLAVLFL